MCLVDGVQCVAVKLLKLAMVINAIVRRFKGGLILGGQIRVKNSLNVLVAI